MDDDTALVASEVPETVEVVEPSVAGAPGAFLLTLKPAGRACCRAETAPVVPGETEVCPGPAGLVEVGEEGSKASMNAELSLAERDARLAAGGPPGPAP